MAKGMWIAPSVPFELLDAYLPKIIAGGFPIELVIKE
jgi:hypothetical protein